jgi:hypothetical protein
MQKSRKDVNAKDTDNKDLAQIHPRLKRSSVLLLVEKLQANRGLHRMMRANPTRRDLPATKVASLPWNFFFKDRRSEASGIVEAIHHEYCWQSESWGPKQYPEGLVQCQDTIASDVQTKLITTVPLRHLKLSENWMTAFYGEEESGPSPNALLYSCQIAREMQLPIQRAFGKNAAGAGPRMPSICVKTPGSQKKQSGAVSSSKIAGSTVKMSGTPQDLSKISQADVDQIVEVLNIIFSNSPKNMTVQASSRGPSIATIGSLEPTNFSNSSGQHALTRLVIHGILPTEKAPANAIQASSQFPASFAA